MWSTKSIELNPRTTKHQILQENKIISFQSWINLIQTNSSFIDYFNQILKDSKYEAFFWEVKPITTQLLHDDFEFVLVGNSLLASIKPNHNSFDKFLQLDGPVVSFPNLRGDAQLVVPAPKSDVVDYAQIAKFVRTASSKEYHEFWKMVGHQYSLKIGKQNKWLSTSGLGVHWLHVRIDSRPKYYQHDEYRDVFLTQC